jgi:SAM-dependent methyltransferase
MGQDKIWDYFQNESKESFEGSIGRLNALMKLIRPGEKVLNIGIGAGIFEHLAIDRGVDVYSLDPNSATVAEIGRMHGLGEKARAGSAAAIPFEDNTFDAVVMSEVIEHIPVEELDSSLREVCRILKTGGRLIGTVPAKEDLRKQMIVCPDCGHRFHRWGHVQSFDLNKMRDTLQPLFDIEVLEWRFLPSWSVMTWKGKLETTVLYIFRMFGAGLANESILFSVIKKPALMSRF